MDRVSVNVADLSSRTSSVSKSDSAVKSVTDDFRMLLQGQNQKADSAEASKKEPGKDTKTEEKPDNSTKDAKDVKEDGKDTVKEEAPKEKTSDTEGLLAAYQMNLNLRPEMIQAEPEAAAETVVPEIQMEAVPEVQEEAVPVQLAPEQQPELKIAEEAAPQIQAGQDMKTEASEPETAEAPKTEQKIAAPEKHEDSSAMEEGNTAQADTHQAEQAVHAAEAPMQQAEVQSAKPQEPVRMYVPQPDALPEKVTDQLLSKMSEGVQEFEIHIEPANLGKIAVKILYQEGQATVSIVCSEKRALDVLGRNAGEIGQVIEKNLGGTTTIIVEKQENTDYLNQQKDENQQNGQNEGKEQQKEKGNDQSAEDAEQFLQKLRLGLAV